MKKITLFSIFISLFPALFSQTVEETAAINALRLTYSKTIQRAQDLVADNYDVCLNQLQQDGRFTDCIDTETALTNSNSFKNTSATEQGKVGDFLYICFARIWRIAENFRGKTIDVDIRTRLFKAIIYYGNLETKRPNVYGRFHRSCFAIPACAVNTYFCLLSSMDLVENGQTTDTLSVNTNTMLKLLGMQTWTQPYRNDFTDTNVVSIERFRNHVWWVGGNAIAYRSLLPVAVMHRSASMINVVSHVAIGALSTVSQTTYNSAFWNEGFTTDGAGWGHGKQCLIWGYPSDGASSAFDLLFYLSNTPWSKNLTKENVNAVLNYIRRSAFYYHNGYVPPLFDRTNAMANKTVAIIRTASIATKLLSNFSAVLTAAEIAELNQFKTESNNYSITMTGYPGGNYNGSRYFFNNDDLIKKNKNYMVLINMASARTYGLESAIDAANGYNFYACDGVTLYQRTGSEYVKAIGAMNQCAWPGITTRRISNSMLEGITHWGGFNSKHNFAVGATSGGNNFSGGFIYDKQDAIAAANGTTPNDQNPGIYDVKAYKGYFMLGDIMVAMGAGITNLNTALSGNITTTIEQTLRKPDLALNGNLIVDERYDTILGNVSTNTTGINWVRNNGFVFGVLPAFTTGVVKLTTEPRQTIWNTLAPTLNSLLESTLAMIQLDIDHGKDVKDGTYVYLVSANGSIPGQLPMIISNTTSVQAVAAADSSVVAAVFYEHSNGFKVGNYTYNVSEPSAILIEDYNSDSLTITITDAVMNTSLQKITLTTTLPISGVNVTKAENIYSLDINLPQGELCGSPATVKVKRLRATSDVPLCGNDLRMKVRGKTVSFSSLVNMLDVYNVLGIKIETIRYAESYSFAQNGIYFLKMSDKIVKVSVGN